MKTWVISLLFLIVVSGRAQTPTNPTIYLEQIYSGLSQTVGIYSCGDHRLFILEQLQGDIEIIDTSGNYIGKFLDLTGLTIGVSERGLLGMAFHPEYEENGLFFVNYTNTVGNSVIARYSVSADPDVADAQSAQIILTIAQPYANHNGGHLAFGPDGYLYIGMGDGGHTGSTGDPDNRSQDPETLLGKMLRIDVNGTLPYSIPPDNPWAASQDTLPEIWAFGLRNPWTYNFDEVTGDLWICDVGAATWEEINFEEAGSPGGKNWGWRCYEGNEEYNTSLCGPSDEYDFPVKVYWHQGFYDFCSITGGYVYRGTSSPALHGHFVFTDYCQGDFFSLTRNNDGSVTEHQLLFTQNFGHTAFGMDGNGELYTCRNNGEIYRIREICGTFQPAISDDLSGNIVCNAPGEIWWWNNGILLEGVTGNVFSPEENGLYYATCAGENGCVRQTNTLPWIVTGGVPGCTYPQALNFNPEATADDGSCAFGLSGCTYVEASNYNPQAQLDDGSCIFPGGVDCPVDLDGDTIIGVSDLVLFLAAFGTVCED